MDNENANWIPLMEYAVQNGMSISTLRRYIKGNKVKHRLVNGRYFIQGENQQTGAESKNYTEFLNPEKLDGLENDLRRAREEIAELKMLVSIYEEQASPKT